MRKLKRQLSERKSRDAKRKLRRLQYEAAVNKLNTAGKRLRTQVQIGAVSRPSEEEVIFGVTTGVFGSPTGTTIKVDHAAIVGCVESNQELGTLVSNLGLLVLAGLVRHNLAEGVDGLAKKLAAFAHIDLEALQAAAEADGETIIPVEGASLEAPTTEQGPAL